MSTPAVEALRRRFCTLVEESVDTLHVAAALESSGITDEAARDRYGSPDVFALAVRLRRDVQLDQAPPAPLRRPRRSAVVGVSAVGNGVVYLLPALAMPALLRLVGPDDTVLALVVGAALGWFWAVVASWHAFAVLSSGSRDLSEDDLRRSVRLGLLLPPLAVLAVVLAGAPPVVGVVAGTITAAQLGTTLLFFLRRRTTLVAVLVAQGGFGLAHLVSPQRVPAELVLVAFALATLALLAAGGVWRSSRAPVPRMGGAGPVLLYAVASVTFLLLPQTQFLRQGGGLPLSLAGLFLTMGYVEWRAGHVSAGLRDALARTSTPAGFRLRTAGLLGREALACAAVTAAAAATLVHLLRSLDLLSRGVVVVALATVVLAAAYLVALVLANTGAWTWLTGAFAGGASVQAGLTHSDRMTVSTAFVVATGVLLVTLVVGLLGRPVHTFR